MESSGTESGVSRSDISSWLHQSALCLGGSLKYTCQNNSVPTTKAHCLMEKKPLKQEGISGLRTGLSVFTVCCLLQKPKKGMCIHASIPTWPLKLPVSQPTHWPHHVRFSSGLSLNRWLQKVPWGEHELSFQVLQLKKTQKSIHSEAVNKTTEPEPPQKLLAGQWFSF